MPKEMREATFKLTRDPFIWFHLAFLRHVRLKLVSDFATKLDSELKIIPQSSNNVLVGRCARAVKELRETIEIHLWFLVIHFYWIHSLKADYNFPIHKSFSRSSLSASLVNPSESEKSNSSLRLWRQHGCWYSSESLQCSYSSLWCSICISDGKIVSHVEHLCVISSDES